MTAQEYLTSELEHCAQSALSYEDKELLQEQGLESFIYSKLTSKKFRKWAVDASSGQQVRRAIELNVSQNKPLQFRYPFGGYKLWRMPGSPEVDWAEFFAIAYYCRYLAPIAAAYKPGLELLFASDDVIIERMDNVPVADTEAYFKSFKLLAGQFQKYLPPNFKLDIVRIGDLYPDKKEMEKELAENVDRLRKEYEAPMDPARKQKMLISSELNIKWDGAKDLTKLSGLEKQKVIDMGPIYHDAYCALSRRREFNRGDDKILIFTTLVPNAIAIGTTKSSITKFWTGFGVLVRKDGGFGARILSPSQLEQDDSSPVHVSVPGLATGNFRVIRIIE